MKKPIIYITWIALSLCSITGVYAAMTYFRYNIWDAARPWVFQKNGQWNAGLVDMRTAYTDIDNLRWSIRIETIGPAVFSQDAQIIPPANGNPARNCWSVVGTIESKNAGTIWLNSWTLSKVRFNPVTHGLEWDGYNNGVWRVPVGPPISCPEDITPIPGGTATTGSWWSEPTWFIGKVKILWSSAGTANMPYGTSSNYGTKFNISLFNTTLQRIRKNIGILSRNLPSNQKNSWFNTYNILGDKLFYINTDTSEKNIHYSSILAQNLDTIRSIIIIWWNLIIDTNIDQKNIPIWIIVLKDANNIWWNIYVQENVQHIVAGIFTEWSLFSGENSTNIYNDTPTEAINGKPKQLYIYGSIISRNTVWWAMQTAQPVCPYNITCDFIAALPYDLNYFRAFQASGATDPNRAYIDTSLDDYSLIIEHDPRLLVNPPPWFE